jgi:hypothetical protein
MSAPRTVDGSRDGEDRLYPTKILRLGAMVESLLMEIRHTSLDPETRELLADVYRRSVRALNDALPADLEQELDNLLPELAGQVPTQAELRVVHAQLHGWLAGLLQGMHIASAHQHLDAKRQLAELGQAAERALAEQADRASRAAYL